MNVCSTNRPKTPKKKGQPNKFTVAQLVNSFTQKNMTALHNVYLQSLTCIEDYVYGQHNPIYAGQAKLKKDTHQRRLNDTSLKNFIYAMKLAEPTLRTMTTFDDVWLEVRKIGKSIPGIGDVMIYDFSLRYCFNKLGLTPNYVYLHSSNGPLEGAKKVLTAMKKKNVTTVNGNTIPINKLRSGTRIPKSNFESDLSALDSKSIEHFLCINHSYNII
ncbi:MAG: hypothetical protein KBT34_13730 [Prevotella sp.]|nr:hypothetical protein [Candidatus Prevotella equi]